MQELSLRIAGPQDGDAVTALLVASYTELFKPGYAPEMLAKALPLMTRANPKLLQSGTFYVVEHPAGGMAGCGGWSMEQPGSGLVAAGEAHVRHFAVHPQWTRKGVGRLIFARCERQAREAGAACFLCYSSLVAEYFYRAQGFELVKPLLLNLSPDVALPGLLMRKNLA